MANKIQVIKKDGTKEKFTAKKIHRAIRLAGERIGHIPTKKECEFIVGMIEEEIQGDVVNVMDLHKIVCRNIRKVAPDVAQSYQNWRDYKLSYVEEFENILKDSERVLFLGDRENANFDSALISTKGSLIRGYLTKSLYKRFCMNKKTLARAKRGDIYIHDMRDMIMSSINCCLFDMRTLMKDGFVMSNIHYSEPKSALAALHVIGDVTLNASSQQFGGFTIPQIDEVLLPYAEKTLESARHDFDNLLGGDEKKREEYAWHILSRELEQGFQALELKLNTVPSSRGDFAFTTLTFGAIATKNEYMQKIQSLICEKILETRIKGHGGVPVVFPKLVYLYSKKCHEESALQRELFDKAIKCSAKCCYPDYLSIDSKVEGDPVSMVYRESGEICSPMGCRAYLSPWKDPEIDKYVTIGRCNIGAVSLNLPLMWKIAEDESSMDVETGFFDLLDENMQIAREFLQKRYETIANTPASTNPLAFTQGGFYHGFRKPEEKIGDLTDYMTASFGYVGLNELTEYARNVTILDDKSGFAKKVLKRINENIAKYKAEDHHLYAIYGTPAESYATTAVNQVKAYLKSMDRDVESASVPEYFTNSFHMHVSEDITPFEKQDAEFSCFHLSPGGHIQYVRVDSMDNYEGIKAIVERGMEMGLYQGLNANLIFCNECGAHSKGIGSNIFECPECGSHDVITISRVCGYLGYSRIGNNSRMNDGKLAEISERKSM